jgi:hypothetical protein
MNQQPPIPTLPQLAKSFLIATVIAGVLLITFILPAEYNIDPLGTGKFFGLDQLAATEPTEANIIPPSTTDSTETTVIAFTENYHQEKRTITLEPYDGIEIKALMDKGEKFVFKWFTDGADVYVDMHGEKLDAKEEFTTYWKEKQQQQASGAFTAPFAGTHGWYWQNMGENAITVTVEVSGFFEKLYTP